MERLQNLQNRKLRYWPVSSRAQIPRSTPWKGQWPLAWWAPLTWQNLWLQGPPQALMFKTTAPSLWNSISEKSKEYSLTAQHTWGSKPTRNFYLSVGGYRIWKSHSLFTLIFWFLGKGYQRFKLTSCLVNNISTQKNVRVSHRPRCSKFTPFLESLSYFSFWQTKCRARVSTA